jgi:hypothetical protein
VWQSLETRSAWAQTADRIFAALDPNYRTTVAAMRDVFGSENVASLK